MTNSVAPISLKIFKGVGAAIGKKYANIRRRPMYLAKNGEVAEYNLDKIQFIRNCSLPAHVMTIAIQKR
jgi:N utilization substance protein A